MGSMRSVLGSAVLVSVLGAALLGCAGSKAPPAAKSAEPGPAGAPAPESVSADSFGGSEGATSEPMAAPAPPMAQSETGSAAPGKAGAATSTPSTERAAPAPKPDDARPGLGTEWGETRQSRISTVPFVRAERGTPFATASLFYNDEQGARAMANASGFRRTSGGMVPIANGVVSIALRNAGGGFLNGFVAGGRNYAVGEAGSAYTIVIRNRSNARFECVVSVDGLDVLDGRAANFSKRGYLVDAGGELEIDGFRQSTETVAAFRFGSVRNSYAGQKHGDTRNVGVIGVAVFHERGSNPVLLDPNEVQRRHDANPFPGQFATPPGR